MGRAWLRCAGATLIADVSGVLLWPAQALLVVADLHLEQGSSLARRGTLLPPYDTRSTLARLEAALRRWQPRRVVSLGDGFHDQGGGARLAADDRQLLERLIAVHDWLWVSGNHDPTPPQGLRGAAETAVEIGGIVLRHVPEDGAPWPEIAGHLHPSASVTVRGRRLRRRCFVGDDRRLLLPAFGSYTGGLDVFEPAIAGLFPRGFRAALVGAGAVHTVPDQRLNRPGAASDPARLTRAGW
jgi:uncharacterized protein